MQLGRKHGALTLLNPAPAQAIDPQQVASVDLMSSNETETRILQGLEPDDPPPPRGSWLAGCSIWASDRSSSPEAHRGR